MLAFPIMFSSMRVASNKEVIEVNVFNVKAKIILSKVLQTWDNLVTNDHGHCLVAVVTIQSSFPWIFQYQLQLTFRISLAVSNMIGANSEAGNVFNLQQHLNSQPVLGLIHVGFILNFLWVVLVSIFYCFFFRYDYVSFNWLRNFMVK